MARARFRFGLQAKVLTAVVGFLILLPAVTLWVVNRQLQEQMEDEALQTLATAESVFLKSLENRTRTVLTRYRAVTAEARFKVTAELGDRKTMDGLLGSMLEDAPDDHEAMIFINDRGELAAGRRRTSSLGLEGLARATAETTRTALGGEGAIGYVGLNGHAYSVVAVPVLSREGARLAGALVVAVRLGETALKELALPRTEVLLSLGEATLASTIAGNHEIEAIGGGAAPERVRRGQAGVRHVALAGEHFMARSGEIAPASHAAAPLRYEMLSSYEVRLRGLQDTRRMLLALGIGGVIVSALLVAWFVRRLIQPLRELSEAAEAVGRGEFSRRIERISNDECGELAGAFNRMTTSLQSSRAELECAMQQVKMTQQQLIQSEKLSAVGQFVAGVAHELNNPLTAVVGFSELLQGMPTDPKTRDFLDRIAKSAHRCHKIVHSLLSFARQHPPERKLVDVGAALQDVLEIMAYDLRTSNVAIDRQFAAELPSVLGDPHQLQQVFVNILGNARQAMESFQREGRIVLRAKQENDQLVLEFQDNGPGIKPENLARIFDPFFTTKPVGKGTGLGLSLCYGIVQEHGGKILARSEPGQGATFVIVLPVAQSPEAASALQRDFSAAPFPITRRPSSGKSVLVIDDEAWILDLAAELLRVDGHDVDTAGGGEQALSLLGKRKFDVIVSDWKMPGLNGVRLYEHLRAVDPQAARRVLFMTGDVVNDTFQDFLRKNQLPCLAKPFAIGEFRAVVAKMTGAALAAR